MEATPTAEELISEGRALVRSLALRIFRNLPIRIDLEDLIAYGELGLAQAARDFDAEQGCQFSTFAYYRIRGEIYDGIAKMTWTSRSKFRRIRYEQMANQVLEQQQDLQAATEQSESKSGPQKALGWFGSTTEKLAVVYLASGVDSDTDPVNDAEDPAGLPEERVMNVEISEKLKALIKTLPAVESRLIQLVYFEGYTLQDTASLLGFSKSWTSRMHAKTLDDLARKMHRFGIQD